MNQAPQIGMIDNLIKQATVVEKGPPSHDLTYNTEIRRLDPKRLIELTVAECAKHVDKELAVFSIDGDFLLEHFSISKTSQGNKSPEEPKAEQALLDTYCKAWEQSFTADNPYHTVSMSAQDRKHIAAGLKAALHKQPTQPQQAPEEQWQISRKHWIHEAMRVYLIAGDTEDQALDLATYLWGEQDTDDLCDPFDAAIEDVEGRPNLEPAPGQQVQQPKEGATLPPSAQVHLCDFARTLKLEGLTFAHGESALLLQLASVLAEHLQPVGSEPHQPQDKVSEILKPLFNKCVDAFWSAECSVSDLACEEYRRNREKIRKAFTAP
jgi:hypothetical protein